MATFRFTAGPWNIHEGNDTFGPPIKKSFGRNMPRSAWPACSSMTTTQFPT